MKQLDSAAYIDSLVHLDKTGIATDGGEQFNRLIFAKSPYLLQHAENPVNWYEWGEEAFDAAQLENRPVLVSIGYATCHWCHVMGGESFEDHEVATLLNRYFICIKVDREERPDIDDFFMTVAQVLTGGGGWPLNVFMTPDKRPFFAMTYLPKHTSHGRRGMMELLPAIATLWRQQPDKIEHNCTSIMDTLAQIAEPLPQERSDLNELQEDAFNQINGIYDPEYGGFGSEPKFPLPMTIDWLLLLGAKGNDEALAMAENSLDHIRRGGIWDHLGGGIHRYAVDRKWLVPHFEKMLYDQAMLSQVSLHAFQITGNERYLGMALDIFGFVLCDMSEENAGFYSAYDADSEGEEGKFYLWIKDEIEEVLEDDAELFCNVYDVTRYGNFEGSVILNLPKSIEEFCSRAGLELEGTEELLEECCMKLLEFRNNRIWPLCDQKIITAWNGLMIGSLAKGGAISGIDAYTDRAKECARFILARLRRDDGRLMRSFMNGVSSTPAFLEDYAFFVDGVLKLYETTLDSQWLDEAAILVKEMIRLFHNPRGERFTKTGLDAEQMPIAASLEHDGVIPSPFSTGAACFIKLSHILEHPEFIDYAFEMINPSLHDTHRHPTAHFGTVAVLESLEADPVIATFSGNLSDRAIKELQQELHSWYIPNLVVRYLESAASKPEISICAKGVCHPACTNRNDLKKLIKSSIISDHQV